MTGEQENPATTEFRSKLEQFFRASARGAGVEIDPIRYSPKIWALTRRLYDEERAGRRINIVEEEHSFPALDGFVKRVGLDSEISLLTVSTLLKEECFPVLWSLYLAWMQRGASEADVLQLIEKSGAGPF